MKRIAIYNAKPGMILAKEIYNRNGRLLLRENAVLTKRWIDKLAGYGIPTVFIRSGGYNPREVVQKRVQPSSGKKAKRFYQSEIPDMIPADIREEAERAIQEIMHNVKTGRLIRTEKVKKVVEKILSQLINNVHIIGKLADIRILDDYTFAHSVNVCILSISTGVVMGYSKNRLRELGIGALLHDVGKMNIPDEILQKRGPLTEKEFEEIKRHTLLGFEMLSQYADITWNAARISLQHHECFNGSGYPWGINDKDIHEYSKIVAVSDVYDALTADRVYKNAILPYEAMEIIIASSGYQFDPEIVKLFVEHCEIYPVGSIVELNSGETGVVIDVNRGLPTRPMVQVIADIEGNELDNGPEIDLMTNPTIFVNAILSFRRTIGP
ncbi:MAG: HD-GYP domain-containing protein [Firmicutes bacterium HGW-Firmicutes-14]|nr:MAG: HD-GYP domain-containing protein [Firmicutes bacterium HGW-Firmicutes-14]